MFKKIEETKEQKVEGKLLTEEKAKQAAANLTERTGTEWKVDNVKGNYVLRTAELDSAAKERIKKISFEDVTVRKEQHGMEMLVQISHPLEILEIAKNNFDLPGLLEEKDPILDKAAHILTSSTTMAWGKEGRGVNTIEKIIAENAEEAEKKAENEKTKVLKEFTAIFGDKSVPPTIYIRRDRSKKAESLHIYFSHPLEIQAICNFKAPVPVEKKKESTKVIIILPDEAKKIYEAVGNAGQVDKLANFTNDLRPDKFKRALELLNIHVTEIEFNGRNGYKVLIDSANLAELHNKTKPKPYTSPSPVVRR